MKYLNILFFVFSSAFGSRGRLRVLVSKMQTKVAERGPTTEYENWLKIHSKSIDEFCSNLDERLWLEAKEVSADIEKTGSVEAKTVPFKMGGAGACSLLYFITRFKKPQTIIETGVALGYSSLAFLTAIEKNRCGRLESSDFPYPGIPNSESFVGIVVPDTLKQKYGWRPLLNGDENNLPMIVARNSSVELIHYDSDKSYRGRERAMKILDPIVKRNTIIVFDDIHENDHFRDFAGRFDVNSVHVFEFKNKFIGVVGRFK